MTRSSILLVLLAALGSRAAAQNTVPIQIGAASGISIDRIDDLDSFGQSTAALGDFDGDGVVDLAVGTPRDDDGGINRGAVWLLMLDEDGAVKSHRKISATQGDFAGPLHDFDFFGTSVAALGDLDGDGVTDLAVGAPRDDDGAATPNANRGAVWILFLRPDGSVREHQKISDTEGGLGEALRDQDRFGSALSGIGDFDGDGVFDLAVGAPGDGGANRGAVWLLLLNPDGTVKSHRKISATEGGFSGHLDEFDNFGSAIAGLGDLDEDGVVDLAVGAFGDDDGPGTQGFRGAVWILHLGPDGTVKSHQKIPEADGVLNDALAGGTHFGSSVATSGDLDGDGVVDLVVGAPEDGREGRGAVWILMLNRNGTIKTPLKIGHRAGGFGTLSENDRFGGAVAGAGDINGDGLPDLIVGAPHDDDGVVGSDRGAVWVLMLHPDGTVERTQKISNSRGHLSASLDAGDNFGAAVATLGDVDGDGVADLAVGAPRDDDGGIDRGAVWLLMLRPDGTVRTHRKISSTEGGFAGRLNDFDFFGNAVAGVGDLDGDGVIDLAVGAARDDEGAGTPNANTGAVWILFLRADGSVKHQQKISGDEGALAGLIGEQHLFGSALSGIGDFDGDGINDLAVGAPGDGGSNRGAVWLLLLNEDGTVKNHHKIAHDQGGFSGDIDEFDNFGAALADLGDLDGDGILELAVGAFGDDDGDDNLQSYRGAVWILFLNADGSVRRHQKISATEGGLRSQESDAHQFGRALAVLGDLDSDGIPDLAAGAPASDEQKGSIWILFMRADGTTKDQQLIPSTGGRLVGLLSENDRFGSAVTRVEHEGAGVIVVGAPGQNRSGNSEDEGAAWLISDIPFPPPRVEDLVVTSGRPTVGSDVHLSARITAVSGVSDVTVSFKRGGDLEFFRATMREQSPELYEITIPAFAASARGIEYFITAINSGGVQTRAPLAGVVSIPVYVPQGLSTPLVHGTASEAYRLISVPLYLENASARAMLEKDLGAYGGNRWRFFGHENRLIELDEQDLAIEPGKAFWMLARDEGRTLRTGPGMSVATHTPFKVVLAPGWNLVGSPFMFSIPPDQIHLSSGQPVDMRSYAGSWSAADSMEPLVGYAVFNSRNLHDTLVVDPHLSAETTSRNLDAAWSIRIVASRGGARDDDNFAVVAAGAAAAWDSRDRPEPPPIGDYVSVSFPHPEWNAIAAHYNTDVRPEPDTPWAFDVRTPNAERVELHFDGLDEVPIEFGVWLIDEMLDVQQNLRTRPRYDVLTPGRGHSRRLSLVVGPPGAIDRSNELPIHGAITSSYPNPFQTAVAVSFGLPEATDVRLELLDLIGRRLAIMASGRMEAGFHTTIWDARSGVDAPLAAGVYFVRLSTPRFADTRRIVHVR